MTETSKTIDRRENETAPAVAENLTPQPGEAGFKELPQQHQAMFNGVRSLQSTARPSVDSGHPLHPEEVVTRLGPKAFPKEPLQDSGQPAGDGPEDRSKSRDDKPGGMVAPETAREASVEESQAAAPTAPQGVVTQRAPVTPAKPLVPTKK